MWRARVTSSDLNRAASADGVWLGATRMLRMLVQSVLISLLIHYLQTCHHLQALIRRRPHRRRRLVRPRLHHHFLHRPYTRLRYLLLHNATRAVHSRWAPF